MKAQEKSGETAATQSAPACAGGSGVAKPATGEASAVKVLVRIEKHGVHALGGVFARGAQVRMSKEQADALVSLGDATILGI